jgi:type V secretory pathway adhesin AidA
MGIARHESFNQYPMLRKLMVVNHSFAPHVRLRVTWDFSGDADSCSKIALGDGFIVEPQAQIVYQNVSLGDGGDAAATVQFRNADSVAARIGARVARAWLLEDSTQLRSITAWVRPSFWNEFSGNPRTLFSSAVGPVPFRSDLGGGWFEFNAGVDARITVATSLFASGGYQHRRQHRSLHRQGRTARGLVKFKARRMSRLREVARSP